MKTRRPEDLIYTVLFVLEKMYTMFFNMYYALKSWLE